MNFNINARLFVAFTIIMIMMMVLGYGAFKSIAIFTDSNIDILTDTTNKMYRHPLAVSNATLNANIHIVAIHRSMKDVVLADTEEEIREATDQVNKHEEEVLRHFQIIQERFLGDMDLVTITLQSIQDWRQIRNDVISLVRAGQYDAAEAITKGKGAKHMALIEKEMNDLIEFARNKALEYKTNSESKYKQILSFMGVLLLLVFLGNIAITIIITRNIKKEINERKQVEEAFNESEKKYRTLFEHSADAILIIEEDKFVDCNTATVRMLGYNNKKDLLETHPSELSPEIQPDGRNSFEKANEMMSIAFDQGSHRFEWDHKRQNSEVFPVEVLLTAVPFGERKFIQVVWRDISERKQAEKQLRESEERFRNLFENAEVSIWNEDMSEMYVALDQLRLDGVTDLRQYIKDNPQTAWDMAAKVKVIHVNEVTLKLFGAKTEDEFLYQIDKTFGEYAIEVFIDELCAIWEGKRVFRSEANFISLDGRDITAIISFHIPDTSEGFKSVPVSIFDITERKHMENELKHSATHDALTGLYNRNVLDLRLDDEIQRASRYNHAMSVFMLDIDHFKAVNDTYGHQTGDTILRNFAMVLESSIRNTDYAARYGGEEFVVILPETPLPKAEELAERLRKQVAEYPFPIGDDKDLKLTVSIGIATFPENAQTGQELLEVADSAMYVAKEAGRNQVKTS